MDGTASGNSSQSTTGTEMGSGKLLASYCPQVLAGKGGKKEQCYTKMWWHTDKGFRKGEELHALFASVFTDMFFSQVCQELNNGPCN